MSADLVRVHVRVRGRVQGVGFRQGVASRARSLGVGGWVANLADGSVEAVFEGPHDLVESMVDWCRRGPSGAHVTGVEATGGGPPRGEAAFRLEFGQRPGG